MDPCIEDSRAILCKKHLEFNSLDKFPPEWLEYIFSFISGFQLHPLLRVCKRWNGLVSDRWLSEVGETKELRQRKRDYYFKREKFSILFTAAEMVRINGTTLSFIRISCKVQPRELGHSVGIVYTCDDWKTVYKWYGFWSSNSPDEQEEYWKIRLWCFPSDARIQFAVHAQDARGIKVWDNNNSCNYEIRINEIPKVTEYLWNWVQH